MLRTFLFLLGLPVGLLAAAGATVMVGMRRRSPTVLNGVRRFNRAVSNPMQVRNGAGGAGSWASVIHHVGRTSGRAYATPIGTAAHEDGFVVALPYGPGADWVRNVLAAGDAIVDDDGRRVHVTDPRLVPLDDVVGAMGAADARGARMFGVRDALLLRIDPTVPEPTPR